MINPGKSVRVVAGSNGGREAYPRVWDMLTEPAASRVDDGLWAHVGALVWDQVWDRVWDIVWGR